MAARCQGDVLTEQEVARRAAEIKLRVFACHEKARTGNWPEWVQVRDDGTKFMLSRAGDVEALYGSLDLGGFFVVVEFDRKASIGGEKTRDGKPTLRKWKRTKHDERGR